MLKLGVIGIGNCGNQIVSLLNKEGVCKTFAINTSENDLAMISSDVPKRIVGDSQGSGKNRTAAKEFLKKNIADLTADEEFAAFVNSLDVVFIASSAGGGSGSGMAPVLCAILKQSFRNEDGSEKIIIMIGVLPRLSEGYTTQVNAMEYAHEVFDVIGNASYMLYDNNKLKNERADRILQMVNQEIVDHLRVLQCFFNNPTPFDSIDEKDMKTILRTPKLISVTLLKDIKEKDLDGTSIEEKLIEEIKGGAHVEIQRDRVVGRTGLISNLSEKLNGTFDTHLEQAHQFTGEPVEEFLHIVVNSDKNMPNNVALIMAGLSPITDRLEKIKERIAEIEEMQKAAEEDAVAASISQDEINRMNEKRGYRDTRTSDDSVDAKSIFEAFGV